MHRKIQSRTLTLKQALLRWEPNVEDPFWLCFPGLIDSINSSSLSHPSLFFDEKSNQESPIERDEIVPLTSKFKSISLYRVSFFSFPCQEKYPMKEVICHTAFPFSEHSVL